MINFLWLYRRPITSACLLIAILVLTLVGLIQARLGQASAEGAPVYSVLIRHFGVDSTEIERSITIPLEDALSQVHGIKDIQSWSEYGAAHVTVTLHAGASPRESYLQVRDSVDRVYSLLPRSVQRPEILSSSQDSRSAFIAAVSSKTMSSVELARLLEREVKPAFERLNGAGEVQVAGALVDQVHIKLHEDVANRAGVQAAGLAQGLQAQDRLVPVGKLTSGGLDIPVIVAGRLKTIEEMGAARIPTGTSSLRVSDLAEVRWSNREPEEIGRLDGQEHPALVVKPAGDANLIELSRAIALQSQVWQDKGLDFSIILDTGRDLEKALGGILEALLLAVLVSALTLPFFVHGLIRIVVLSLSIPLMGLSSAAVLVWAGFGLDQYILSGLAVGIGTVVDTGIILAAAYRIAEPGTYFATVVRLVPALLASTLTALVVLIPLVTFGNAGGGARLVALALATLIVVAFALSLAFLPPWLSRQKTRISPAPRSPRNRTRAAISGNLIRSGQILILWAARRPVYIALGSILLIGGGVVAVLTMGLDLESGTMADSIPVHVECPPGTSLASVDETTVEISRGIHALTGVRAVQSTSRRESAELEVAFDPRLTTREKVAVQIRTLGEKTRAAFVYLPEGAGETERSIGIVLSGTEESVLKTSAHAVARILGAQRVVNEVVLNFKDAPPNLVFHVDPARSAALGTNAEEIAQTLRWHLYGPVALKWLADDREVDVRIQGAGSASDSSNSLEHIPVGGPKGVTLSIASLGHFQTEEASGKLYRKDRQRALYMTVQVSNGDLSQIVSQLRASIASLALPPGYAVRIGDEVIEQADRLSGLWLVVAACLLLVYLLLGILSESLVWPLVVLAVIPASLSLPLVIMKLCGFRLMVPVLIGCIVLIGMAVNNSILIVDAYRERGRTGLQAIALAVRSRMVALSASSAVTVLGHVPLLLVPGAAAGFMRSLAFVIIWGIVASYLATLFLIPSLIALVERLRFHRYPVQERPA